MIRSIFWNSNFFSIGPIMDPLFTTITLCSLSAKEIAQDPRCTWEFLSDYNVEKWSDLTHKLGYFSGIYGKLLIISLSQNYGTKF